VPKFGRKVPHLWCDSQTSFKVKRSKVKLTRPINAHIHRAACLPNGKAYELQIWCTDGGRRPASLAGAMTSKVKAQGRKVTWSVWVVLAQCCTCVIRARRGHTVSAEPGGHIFCCPCCPARFVLFYLLSYRVCEQIDCWLMMMMMIFTLFWTWRLFVIVFVDKSL